MNDTAMASNDSPRLTFGDLEPGDHFVSFPIPGDDDGHGGYLGAHRVFAKTSKQAPASYKDNGVAVSGGVDSIFPNSMPVIKVQIDSTRTA